MYFTGSWNIIGVAHTGCRKKKCAPPKKQVFLGFFFEFLKKIDEKWLIRRRILFCVEWAYFHHIFSNTWTFTVEKHDFTMIFTEKNRGLFITEIERWMTTENHRSIEKSIQNGFFSIFFFSSVFRMAFRRIISKIYVFHRWRWFEWRFE